MTAVGAIARRLVLSLPLLRRLSVAYCRENRLLPNILITTPPDVLRQLLMLPPSAARPQLNQDIFALLVNRFRPGFFLEIGAHDGVTFSNTLYLEECFGWQGILVEANPEFADRLSRRRARTLLVAVADEEGNGEFVAADLFGGIADSLDSLHRNRTRGARRIVVPTRRLATVLKQGRAPRRVDFVSIDVEGAELPIVRQLCALEDYRFTCGCIEHNHRRRDREEMERLLGAAGYRVVWAGQTLYDMFFVDSHVVQGEVTLVEEAAVPAAFAATETGSGAQ